MKRINLTLLSTPLVIAPIAIVSCTWFKDDTAARIKAEVKEINRIQDYTKPNKWLDTLFTDAAEKELMSGSYDKGSIKGYSFKDNEISTKFETIKVDIASSKYADGILDKQFAYTEFKDTPYIKNFLSIYTGWEGSKILGYHEKSITEKTTHPTTKKKIWIASHGGPLGYIVDKDISTDSGDWNILRYMTTPVASIKAAVQSSGNSIGVDLATFNQAQYGFVPSTYINGVDAKVKKILLDRIKSNKNFEQYKILLNTGTLNNYTAMKLMLGNVDLPVSRALESMSESMIEINSIRKELMIDHYTNAGYDVILGGTSYGYEEIVEETMINPSILKKSFSLSIGLNYLNKAIKGSRRQSGGIVTPTMESSGSLKGNNGTVDQLLFFSTQYAKQKYGVLEGFKKQFKADPTYLKKFQDKVSIFLGGSDFNVGIMTNYEANFMRDMKIPLSVKQAEGHTIDAFPNKKWFAEHVFKEELYNATEKSNRFYIK